MLNMFKYINMFLWFIINRIGFTIFSKIGDIYFESHYCPHHSAGTHLLPSPPDRLTLFSRVSLSVCLTSPCGSCTKSNPSASCLSLFKLSSQYSPKCFSVALYFVSIFSFFPPTKTSTKNSSHTSSRDFSNSFL